MLFFPSERLNMQTKEVEITSKDGLHVRPASRFVKKAKEFASDITVSCGELEASAKSLFKFQALPLEHGAKMIIKAEGPDENEAIQALITIINEVE